MCQAKEAQFTSSTAQTGKHHSAHLDGDCTRVLQWRREGDDEHAAYGEPDEYDDAHIVGDLVDKVRGAQFGQKRGNDIGEEHDAFGDIWADEVEGRGEDDYVEHVVYEA